MVEFLVRSSFIKTTQFMKSGIRLNPPVVYLIFLLSAIQLLSCKSKKIAMSPEDAITESITYKSALKHYSDQYPDYSSMSADVNMRVNIDGDNYRVSGKIMHDPGNILFASVKKLGFELGRVWITQDSFIMLNRLENEYIREPLSSISEKYDIRGSLSVIEELVTGIPRLGSYTKSTETTIIDDQYALSVPSVYEDIELNLFMNAALQLRHAVYKDRLARKIRVWYDLPKTSELLPLNRQIKSEGIEGDQIDIELSYLKISTADVNIPSIQIPTKFRRTSL